MSELIKQMLEMVLDDDILPQGWNNDIEGAACCVVNKENHTKISIEDFELTKLLGRGSYGYVYLVRKIKGHDLNKYYAMKVLKKPGINDDPKDIERIRTERNILAATNHPFVVEMFYSFQTNDKVFMVLEYLRGGDLQTLLQYKEILSEEHASFYASELILALGHLHELGIIHRDIKPENIVVDADGHLKVTDFGLSKENMHEGNITYTGCGTLPYSAPEILHRIGHTRSVDWWSLGVLMYQMITGEKPFMADSLEEVMENITSKNVRFPMFLSYEVRDLVRSLLKRMACQRLGGGEDDAIEIQSHEFFKQTNWADVLARRVKPPLKPIFDDDDNVKQFVEESLLFLDSPPPREDDLYFPGFSYEAPSVLDDSCPTNRQDPHAPPRRKWYRPHGEQENWSLWG